MLHVCQIIIPHLPDVNRIWADNMLLSGIILVHSHLQQNETMYKSPNFLPVFIKAFQFNLNQVYLYIAFHDTNSCKAALQKM